MPRILRESFFYPKKKYRKRDEKIGLRIRNSDQKEVWKLEAIDFGLIRKRKFALNIIDAPPREKIQFGRTGEPTFKLGRKEFEFINDFITEKVLPDQIAIFIF